MQFNKNVEKDFQLVKNSISSQCEEKKRIIRDENFNSYTQ
jgi:hypothetical protein